MKTYTQAELLFYIALAAGACMGIIGLAIVYKLWFSAVLTFIAYVLFISKADKIRKSIDGV